MKIFQSYRFLLISALPLLLVSCFAAKNYERPKIEEVNALYRTDQTSTDTVSIANVTWRDLFTDPVLTQYIEEGLQNNLDLRIAIQQMNAAEAYLKQGKVGYFP